MSEATLITDAAALVENLEDAWRTNPPLRWNGQPHRTLLGSEADQESATDNPYWEIVRRFPLERQREVDGYPAFGRLRPCSRHELAKTFAWSVPTPGDLAWIAGLLAGRGIVEMGAGTGYWAWQLTQAGVDVVAFDAEPGGNHYCEQVQYHPVLEGKTQLTAHYSDRALLLCWPPYDDPMAADALRSYEGDLLIYVGESAWGCTGGDDFFALRDAEWEHIEDSPAHVTFSGIHCHVEAYRRKQVSS